MTVGILALVVVGVYTAYQLYLKGAVSSDLDVVNADLAEIREQTMEFENELVLGTISAKEAFVEFQSENVDWSMIVEEIQDTIPRKGGRDIIEILSYSGSSNNDLSMNVRTNPERNGLYLDVADFIKEFDESDRFVDSFVSSITSGLDEEGRAILNFVFSTRYVPQGESLEENISDILDDSLEVEEPVEEPEELDTTTVTR